MAEAAKAKGTRIAGWKLRLVAWLATKPLTGRLIRAKMLDDLGFGLLRKNRADGASPLRLSQPVMVPQEVDPREGRLGRVVSGRVAKADGFTAPTVSDFAQAYRQGRCSPMDVAKTILAAVDRSESQPKPYRFFIAQDPDDLLAQAEASADRFKKGAPLGHLDGVPVGVKDELDQAGYGTTVGTSFLGKERVREDATAVGRLRDAGAMLIGKLNMHEIGMGVTGINPHHGVVRNPFNSDHLCGGSSGGPGAAVAAGLCPVSIGADGGGSIRIPASFCGTVGLKATFGRVSEHGAAPLCWSVAHVGPLANTAMDAAIAYAVIAGPDRKDPGSLIQPEPTLEGFGDTDLSGVRIGLDREWIEIADPGVRDATEHMISNYRARGATLVELRVPDVELTRVAHLTTIAVELGASQIAKSGDLRDFGHDNRLNLVLAQSLSGAEYVHAQRLRQILTRQYYALFDSIDLIATPTSGCTAPELKADAVKYGESDLPLLTKVMRFAPAANLIGLPAISIPAGYDDKGLPYGFQLMGRPWEEHLLLRMANLADGFVARRKPAFFADLLPV